MNVRLLRKIAKVIQEKPRQFKMDAWHENKRVGLYVSAIGDLPETKRISCSTTHCIAGWAQVLAPNSDIEAGAEDDAKRVLGLNEEQAKRLFYGDRWPKGFGKWRPSATQAAGRIERFIKSKGAE